MEIGEIIFVGDDGGHLWRTDEDAFEHAENAFATAYTIDEHEAREILEGLADHR